MVHFNKVTIIGVGLIGGSLAKVMKQKGIAGEVVGSGRSRGSLEQALKLGVIDRMEQSAAEAVKGADLVVLASPVGSFEQVLRDIGPSLKKGAILTDVGSVKGELVEKIESMLPAGVSYVPAHPVAGKETSGVAESLETLFHGAKCILTPTPGTDPQALEAVKSLWAAAGANIVLMDPDTHDHVFAAVSHLPHVAAYAMVCAVAELRAESENYINYTGGGFRDFTRIAASSPEMWRDICLMNRKNIVEMIERFQFALNKLKRAIRRSDGEKIEKMFRSASDVRRGLG
jgi:prephenate dehydrogenase